MSLPVDGDLLRRVLAGLPEFILIVDRDRMIRYINRVEPGYDAEDVVGQKSTDVLLPESREVLEEAMDRAFEHGEVAPYEVQAQHPDGSDSWYGGEVTPVREGDDIVGAVIRASNITELRSVKDELVQVRRLLPMCAWCGEDPRGKRCVGGISSYLKRVGKTDVSHGLCAECEDRHLSRAEGA